MKKKSCTMCIPRMRCIHLKYIKYLTYLHACLLFIHFFSRNRNENSTSNSIEKQTKINDISDKMTKLNEKVCKGKIESRSR